MLTSIKIILVLNGMITAGNLSSGCNSRSYERHFNSILTLLIEPAMLLRVRAMRDPFTRNPVVLFPSIKEDKWLLILLIT